jgi:sensor domain CHASE-containing protein
MQGGCILNLLIIKGTNLKREREKFYKTPFYFISVILSSMRFICLPLRNLRNVICIFPIFFFLSGMSPPPLLPLNEPPVITSSSVFNADENQTSIGTIIASDADGDILTYSISGVDILISDTGVLTFASAPDYETKNSYSALVTVSDGEDQVTQDITVNVKDVDETPNQPPFSMLTAPGVWQFNAYENQLEIFPPGMPSTDGVVTFNDGDDDVLTYSISGSEINISSDGGLLTFVSAPDFEMKNLYTATVTASDGSDSASAEVEIHILNVNEAPIAQPQPRAIVLENSTEVVLRANSLDPDNGINALDPEGGPDLLHFSLSGQDASKLSIDSNGDVRFKEPPNFECPEDEGLNNIYDFNVVVTDGFNLSAESDSSIQVSNIASPAQVGDSLFVEEDEIFSGSGVSISGSGSIIAVLSRPDNGSGSFVRVYQNTDDSWIQLGNTLSAAGAIALNESGLILASGNKVFEYSSGTWQQLGIDIPTGGISQVALSADGLTLAIGGSSNFAKVFEYTQDQWVQLGSTLEGETIDGNGIGFGSSVSLNNDGNVLAVSAPGNNTSIDGLTRIYSLSNNEWIQLGSDINGEQPNDDSGTSISLNGTGSIIAIGAMNNTANSVSSWGHVRVFEYKDGSWQQMGGDIDGKSNGSASGTSVSINNDGNIVAVGAPGQKSCNLNRSGQVRVFKLTSGEWIQLGDDIDGPSSESGLGQKGTISFDNAGNTLIVGAYAHENENGANSGLVKVYEFNDTPVITSSLTFSVDENQTAIGTVVAEGAVGTVLTYKISGTDILISDTGVLSFASDPDYEIQNTYFATVTVSDGEQSISQEIVVNILNLEEGPLIISSLSSFNAEENQTAIGIVVAEGAVGSILTYTISDNNFLISDTGVLSFASDPDYEIQNTYYATVTVSDGEQSISQNIVVRIVDLEEGPLIISSVSSFSADENQTSIGSIVASDLVSGTLTYSISGTDLLISDTGVLSFASAPDYEIQNTYYATITVSNGVVSISQNIVVRILEVEPLTISSSSSFSTDENQTAIGTIYTNGPVDSILTYSISGTDILISNTGVLTFASAPDYEIQSTYYATITVSDGENFVTQDIIVTIRDVFELPTGLTSSCETFANEALSNEFRYCWEEAQSTSGTEYSANIVQPLVVTFSDNVIEIPDISYAELLYSEYGIILASETSSDLAWSNDQAYAIHQMMQKIPQDVRNEVNDRREFSKWTLTSSALTDDIVITTNSDDTKSVNISEAAFANANPRIASVEGKKGIYFSNRLHLAVVRFVTDNGTNQAKVNKILEERYGVSINIPDYQALTGEAASRFQAFQASELISIINMFEEMPSGFHKIDGLDYLVRRLNGAENPNIPAAPAIAWDTLGYIEFMEKGFKQFSIDYIHRLILHEKAHFLWAKVFNATLKADWVTLGGWYECSENPEGWCTTKQTEFVSAYAHEKNPNEDMAESIAFFTVNPDALRSRSLAKYEFIRDRIMQGNIYISRIQENLTFEVYNLYPDYVFPGKIKKLQVSVLGDLNEDKTVTVEIELHALNKVLEGASRAFIRMMSTADTWVDLFLYPLEGRGTVGSQLKGSFTLTKRAKSGYWKPTQLVLKDAVGNLRMAGVNDFGWRMYVNNPLEDTTAPLYIANSMQLSLSSEIIESQEVQTVIAKWAIEEEYPRENQGCAGALNDDNPSTYSFV